jgi:hypothetical protein
MKINMNTPHYVYYKNFQLTFLCVHFLMLFLHKTLFRCITNSKKRLPTGKGYVNLDGDDQDEFDILENGDLVQTKFDVLMDLSEETPVLVPQKAHSPMVMGSPAHTQLKQPALAEVELVQYVAAGVPPVMSPTLEGQALMAKLPA